MAEVTPTGIAATGLAEFISAFQATYRAVFGMDLEFEAASVQQQQIGVLSEWGAEYDDALIAVNNGQSLEHAVNYQLDFIGNEQGQERFPAASTTVTLTMGGVIGTVIAARRRAQTSDGIIFATDASATIGSGGSVSVGATALVAGLVPVAANTVTQIVDVVSGWESVNNVSAGVTGRNREADTSYRSRIKRQRQKNAIGSLASIQSAVEVVDGVTKVNPLENPTSSSDTVDGVTIAANSIYIVVKDGADDDIAEAIYNTKMPGGPTDGSVTVNVSRGNWTVPVSFQRPTETPVSVALTIETLPGFPSNGIAQVTQILLDFVDNLDIGESIRESRAFVAVLAVPGLEITGAIVIARKTGTDAVTIVAGNELFTLAFADIAVTI